MYVYIEFHPPSRLYIHVYIYDLLNRVARNIQYVSIFVFKKILPLQVNKENKIQHQTAE